MKAGSLVERGPIPHMKAKHDVKMRLPFLPDEIGSLLGPTEVTRVFVRFGVGDVSVTPQGLRRFKKQSQSIINFFLAYKSSVMHHHNPKPSAAARLCARKHALHWSCGSEQSKHSAKRQKIRASTSCQWPDWLG